MQIKRDYYLNKLIDSKNDGLIKVITGIRRCGKSYLLDPLFIEYLKSIGVNNDHIIKLELDREKNKKYRNPEILDEYLHSLLKDNDMYYIILDEIQLVEGFEGVLNGLLYEKNVDVYVTGSNSKFLSTDIITEFRGRGEEIRIYPLSFYEFMSVYRDDKFDGWLEYITYGGLPLVVSMNNDERKMAYLNEQQRNVYINDVIERNDIKNDAELINLVEISSYLKYLEEAFLIEKAERYDVKGKKYISTPYKFYFSDLGLRNSFINFRQTEETHIMENVIYLELKRRGYNVDVGVIELKERNKNEFTYKQLEVDFIANKGNNKIYIQSAFNMPSDEKINQEERPLLKINDSFKKIIIVKDYIKRTRNENGIIIMSIFDFLLDSDSLNY